MHNLRSARLESLIPISFVQVHAMVINIFSTISDRVPPNQSFALALSSSISPVA